MEKYNKFSLTGFKDPNLENKIIQTLIHLGGKHIQKLSQNTTILVVDSTRTEKFKIAQLHKNPIHCVSKKWVEDSEKKKTLLPPDRYLITEKQLFLGTNVAICGFPPDKQQKLERIITERQGTVITKYKAVDIIRKYEEIPEEIDVILASKDEVQRGKHAKLPNCQNKDEMILPLVRIEWLQDSLKSKRCKCPDDYAVNLIMRKSIECYKERLKKKLDLFLQNDTMDKSGDFLENTLIFLDKDFTVQMAKYLKNLISVCGGYWTDSFSSVVTHVLLMQIDEDKNQYYKKYGSRIYILRPEWLVDSILFYNRLPEEDYHIRIFTPKGQLLKNLIQEEQIRNNQNSQNFNSLQEQFAPKLMLNTNTLPNLQMPKKNSKSQLKTTIFQGRDFYVPPEIFQDPEYGEIRKMIDSAGGTLYSRINSKMTVFVILKDSPKNKEIIENLKKAHYRCKVLSERWVKDCLKKNEFIRPERTFLHYEAFQFSIPMPVFHRFVFEVIGYDDLTKVLRIRELIQTLGSKRRNPNKSEITHVICGPHWNKDAQKVINRISKQNTKFKVVHTQWLLDCVNQCKVVDETPYLVRSSEIQHQTPIKIQETIASNSDKKSSQVEKQCH